MKKILAILALLVIGCSAFASPSLEIDTGLVYEFEAIGFTEIGKTPDAIKRASAYGIDVGMKYSVLYADISTTYRFNELQPLKARVSLNLAFDFWNMRIALGLGNDFSLIKDGDILEPAWGGVSEGSPFKTPMFLRLETSFSGKYINAGFVFNFATPYILSKNNFPDVIRAYTEDENIRIHYLTASSIAFIVQWKIRP